MTESTSTPGRMQMLAAAVGGAALVAAVWGATAFPRRSPEHPEAVVKALYAAFDAGDMKKIRSLIAEDATWEQYGPEKILPFTGKRIGPDGVRDFFAKVDETLANSTQTSREFIVAGDKVAVPGAEESTVKKTGVRYRVNNLHLFTVHDGKIKSFEEYIDGGTMVLAFTRGCALANPENCHPVKAAGK